MPAPMTRMSSLVLLPPALVNMLLVRAGRRTGRIAKRGGTLMSMLALESEENKLRLGRLERLLAGMVW
jgi:hypothetical protein